MYTTPGCRRVITVVHHGQLDETACRQAGFVEPFDATLKDSNSLNFKFPIVHIIYIVISIVKSVSVSAKIWEEVQFEKLLREEETW